MITPHNDDDLRESIEDWDAFNRILNAYRYDVIMDNVEKGPVLDVGCGEGILSEMLAMAGFDVTAIDMEDYKQPDDTRVNYLTDRFEEVVLGKFETVIATHVIEHSIDADRFLARCNQAFARSGRLIVTCPNALSLHKRIANLMSLHNLYELSAIDSHNKHRHIFDLALIMHKIQNAGFRIVQKRGLMLKPFPSAMMYKHVDQSFHEAFWKVSENPDIIELCSSLMIVAEKI